MTKRKRPKVKTVTGSVNKTIIGFTKILSKPNTIATYTDVKNVATSTPGSKLAINNTKMAVINILRIKFIKLSLRIRYSKITKLFHKTRWGFLHEANDPHWESFQKQLGENENVSIQNLNLKHT